MSKEVLFKKGYHLEVTSWENDADNYQTNRLFVGLDQDLALTLLRVCKELFNSKNKDKKAIGNILSDEYEKAGEIAQEYLKENPKVLEALNKLYDTNIDVNDFDFVYDIVIGSFNSNILGTSEYYCSRVFDYGRIIYTPIDLEFDVILELNRG